MNIGGKIIPNIPGDRVQNITDLLQLRKLFKLRICDIAWERLSDKETKFVEDCEEMMSRKGFITDKMWGWFLQIYEKKNMRV